MKTSVLLNQQHFDEGQIQDQPIKKSIKVPLLTQLPYVTQLITILIVGCSLHFLLHFSFIIVPSCMFVYALGYVIFQFIKPIFSANYRWDRMDDDELWK